MYNMTTEPMQTETESNLTQSVGWQDKIVGVMFVLTFGSIGSFVLLELVNSLLR